MDSMMVDLTQLTKFNQELRELPTVFRQELLRGAAQEVMTTLRDSAIALAPELAGPERAGDAPPGNLKRAIYCMRLPEACTDTLEAWIVDVRKGKGSWRNKSKKALATNTVGAYYGGWVEYGHWSRTPASVLNGKDGTRNERRKRYQASGQATWIQAQPYMRPAVEVVMPAMGGIMQQYIDRNSVRALAANKILKQFG